MQKLIRTLLFLSAILAVTATASNAYADSFSVSWSGRMVPVSRNVHSY